jgi:glycosyltransferase involved in cell wall biosynthesis
MIFIVNGGTDIVTDPEIAIVILEYNRAQYLNLLLARLTEQDIEPVRFRVIVVDNGSAEPLRSIADHYSSRLLIEYLRIGRPRSIAVAKNLGISSAVEPLVLVLDGDVLPDRDLVRRHLEALSAPETAVSIGSRRESRVCSLMEPAGTPATSYNQLHRAAESDLRIPQIEAQIIQENFDRIGYYFMYGHNFALWRKFAVDVGGFDEGLDGYGLEDLDFAFRLRLALPDGYVMTWSPQAATSHIPHLRDFDENMSDRKINKGKLLRKHRSFHWEGTRHSSVLGECARILLLEKLADYLRDTRINKVGLPDVERWLGGETDVSDTYLLGIHPVSGWDGVPDCHRSSLVTWRDSSTPSFYGGEIPVDDGSFNNVVNTDLWRVLTWNYVSENLTEALRVARNAVFVATARHDAETAKIELDGARCAGPRFVVDTEWLTTALREFGFTPAVMRTGEVMAVCVTRE